MPQFFSNATGNITTPQVCPLSLGDACMRVMLRCLDRFMIQFVYAFTRRAPGSMCARLIHLTQLSSVSGTTTPGMSRWSFLTLRFTRTMSSGFS